MSFTQAADALKEAKTLQLSNDELLAFYALYKQATVGDNNTSKPGMLDFKGKAKWQAWNKQKGKSKQDAETEYIALVKETFTKNKIPINF